MRQRAHIAQCSIVCQRTRRTTGIINRSACEMSVNYASSSPLRFVQKHFAVQVKHRHFVLRNRKRWLQSVGECHYRCFVGFRHSPAQSLQSFLVQLHWCFVLCHNFYINELKILRTFCGVRPFVDDALHRLSCLCCCFLRHVGIKHRECAVAASIYLANKVVELGSQPLAFLRKCVVRWLCASANLGQRIAEHIGKFSQQMPKPALFIRISGLYFFDFA